MAYVLVEITVCVYVCGFRKPAVRRVGDIIIFNIAVPGSQRSEVVCTELEGDHVEDRYCNVTNKPDDKQRVCNVHLCPARYLHIILISFQLKDTFQYVYICDLGELVSFKILQNLW